MSSARMARTVMFQPSFLSLPRFVLGEESTLLQLLDEAHTAECRLVRRRVAASRHTQLVVELANSSHSCGGGQSSHERLPNAFERLQHVYKCLRVYLGCDRSYRPIVPGMVLPCALEIVKHSAERRFALQKL